MNGLKWILAAAVVAAAVYAVVAAPELRVRFGTATLADAGDRAGRHLRATYSPLHFKPAIETARDEQCLACHKEVLDDKPRNASIAGVKTAEAKAWYQQMATYAGEQESFHRRHLVTPLARQLMSLACNTCHEGHDPRDETPGSSATGPAQSDAAFTLRKQVNPETSCLKCHGQMNWQVMVGLTGPWPQVREMFQNNCLACHAAIRTNRHRVDYLDADAIEKLAQEKGGDVCYGCHGGRAWYRISYPYARNPWPGMAPDTPEWARLRPRHSEVRFLQAKNR